MKTVGIDIGGTFVKVVLVDEKFNILNSFKVPFKKEYKPKEYIKFLYYSILVNFKDDFDYVGVGVPGIVDSNKGTVKDAFNLGWLNVKLVKLFSKYCKKPIRIINDADTIGLLALQDPSFSKYHNYICLTIGTGIGSALIQDDRLIEGTEFGHVELVKNGVLCGCGKEGCIESYCSITALKRAYGENIPELFEKAKQKDNDSNIIINNYIEYLVKTFLLLDKQYNVEAFILAGGLIEQKEFLTYRINEYIKQNNINFNKKILFLETGYYSGALGACCLFR